MSVVQMKFKRTIVQTAVVKTGIHIPQACSARKCWAQHTNPAGCGVARLADRLCCGSHACLAGLDNPERFL